MKRQIFRESWRSKLLRSFVVKLTLSIFVPAAAVAQGTQQVQTTVSQSEFDPAKVGRPTPTPYLAPTGGGGGGAANSAKSAEMMQLLAAGASTAMGAKLMSMCSKKNYPACVMAGISFAQAGMLMGNAAGSRDAAMAQSTAPGFSYSGETQAEASCIGAGCTKSLDPNSLNTNSSSTERNKLIGAVKAEYDALSDELSRAGVEVSKDGSTVKLPDGRTIKTANMATTGGMRGEGFSDSEISGASAALAEAKEKARDKIRSMAAAVDGATGGGGTIVRGGDSGDGSDSSAHLRMMASLFDQKKRASAAKVSGMVKQLGNEPIGVSGDDIFEMIKRRYQARDAANSFLKD
jgi:hypothetical protein